MDCSKAVYWAGQMGMKWVAWMVFHWAVKRDWMTVVHWASHLVARMVVNLAQMRAELTALLLVVLLVCMRVDPWADLLVDWWGCMSGCVLADKTADQLVHPQAVSWHSAATVIYHERQF